MSFHRRQNYTVLSVEKIFMKVMFNPSPKLGRLKNCKTVTTFDCMWDRNQIQVVFRSSMVFAMACLLSFKVTVQRLTFGSTFILSREDTWSNLRSKANDLYYRKVERGTGRHIPMPGYPKKATCGRLSKYFHHLDTWRFKERKEPSKWFMISLSQILFTVGFFF